MVELIREDFLEMSLKSALKEGRSLTSGQDGGVGRLTVPPRKAKRRTTNLKTNKNPKLTENQTV